MTRNPRSPLALVVVLSLAAGAVLAQEAPAPVVRARPPAKPVSFEQTLAMQEDVFGPGGGEPMSSTISIVHDVACAEGEAPPESETRLSLHYRRSRVSTTTIMGDGLFDSNDHDPLAEGTRDALAQEDGLGPLYAYSFGLMGRRRLTVGLAPDGATNVVDGLEPVREGIRGMRSTQFGPSLVEDTAHRPELLFLSLGDGPHALGAKWKRELSWIAPVGGPRVRSEVTYEVTTVEDDTITVTFGGEPELVLEWGEVSDDDRGPFVRGMLKAKLETRMLVEGSFSGTATVSRADGLPVSLSWSLELEQTLQMVGSDYRTKTKLTNAVKRVASEE